MLNCHALIYLFKHYHDNLDIQALYKTLNTHLKENNIEAIINLYNKAIPIIDDLIWNENINKKKINDYQSIFPELEKLITLSNNDSRHNFIISIPVADRPKHLETCLQSILTLCKTYQYGGFTHQQYKKIKVLITDDSKYSKNIKEHKKLAGKFTQQGLTCIHLGIDEQISITNNNVNLKNIVGDISADKFHHKGASITRNISYLKLKQIKKDKTLFYFIDSDQTFDISIEKKQNGKNIAAINYFYYLDRIFTSQDITILTGKVVGDPPVSPSVMAGNFLDDVIYFLNDINKKNRDIECPFHAVDVAYNDNASYHDMADLFGYKASQQSHTYPCDLIGTHTVNDCYTHFTEKLHTFFDGAHPTRGSRFQYENYINTIKPARTIYSGNYIFNEHGLKYFIPFANLKLRMAGPVLGRIIEADIGDKFVSANLPMTHKRTVDNIRQSECRPGVEHKKNTIDLSDEFIRQFFGDVMLFSMVELTRLGYPNKKLNKSNISNIIKITNQSMLEKYKIKHEKILTNIETLHSLLDSDSWWNQHINQNQALTKVEQFIKNIELNFGENAIAYQSIQSKHLVDEYLENILTDILSYTNDSINWQRVMNTAL